MKTLLLLLLTCLPLWAATTYPMLSDTTNRTVTGGVTNLSFLNSNSVFTGTARWMGIATLTNTGNIFVGDGSGLTGVGIPTSGGLATNLTATGLTVATGQTNTHLTASSIVTTDANKGIVSGTTTADLATLSANQTFTGTNTFPAASFYPANNIGMRLLWNSPTNIYFSTLVTNATTLTNNGDYVNCSPIFSGTIPPLLGSNSVIFIAYTALRTNANSSLANMSFFIGTNTNCIGYSGISAATRGITSTYQAAVLQSAASWTDQVAGANFALQISATNFTDTSVTNTFYMGAWTTANHTNFQLMGLRLYEFYAP